MSISSELLFPAASHAVTLIVWVPVSSQSKFFGWMLTDRIPQLSEEPLSTSLNSNLALPSSSSRVVVFKFNTGASLSFR